MTDLGRLFLKPTKEETHEQNGGFATNFKKNALFCQNSMLGSSKSSTKAVFNTVSLHTQLL